MIRTVLLFGVFTVTRICSNKVRITLVALEQFVYSNFSVTWYIVYKLFKKSDEFWIFDTILRLFTSKGAFSFLLW